MQHSIEQAEPREPTTAEFLDYLHASSKTESLADELSWIVARRHAVARAEQRLAS